MKVNFLLTCYNREEYVPHLLAIIRAYKTIEPTIFVGYTGVNTDFPCDLRLVNPGHQQGDILLTLGCYDLAKNTGTRMLKLAADSWLINEQSILNIFTQMEERQIPYAGNLWHHNVPGSLATDIIFADTRYGDVFEEIRKQPRSDFEITMWDAVCRIGKGFYEIPERRPVHMKNRYTCPELGWTMEHSLELNLKFTESYKCESI